MNLPSDTPRLPKWIFLTGDLVLVATIWIVWSQSDHPIRGTPLLAIVVCAVVATVLGAFPFITDYVRWQEEALDNRQRALQALALTVTASSEQIAIAASGLDRLAGIAQENFNQSDRVAQQIQEKMTELLGRLSDARRDDGEAAARLEAVAKKIAKAAAEFEASVARAQEPARLAPVLPAVALELPPVLASQIVEIKPAVSPSSAPFAPPAPAPAEAAAPAPAPQAAPEPAPAAAAPQLAPEPSPPAAPPPETAAAVPEAAAPQAAPPAEPPAPRKRAPRKAAPAEAAPDLPLDIPAAPAPASAEPGTSADGATRLVVTAYIGIGNRLFIRGDGPGLSWDKGVPLTFVSIGKWRWEAGDAAAPVKFKLYKNDEIECTSLGERSVEPGAQQNLTASF